MSEPTVSVIIPTYYRNELLREAIQSVQDQDHSNVELIVVDDSGEGFARDTVEEFDVDEYIAFDENRGDNNARTAGVKRSKGKYISFLDDDDTFHKTKLTKQVSILEQNDDVGVVYCGIEFPSRIELPDPDVKGEVLSRALRFDMSTCTTSTLLIRKDLLLDILPLKQRPGASDLGWIIELAQRTKFEYVNEPLVSQPHSEDSQGSSIGAAHGRQHIIEEYNHLYEKFDKQIKKRALRNMHFFTGITLLRNKTWSPAATVSFIKAYYHSRDFKDFMRIIASLFGMQGFKIGAKIYYNASE